MRFDEKHKAALALFWGDCLAEEPDDALDAVIKSKTADLSYHSWFAYDYDLGNGQTPFELFLKKEGRNLRTGERNFLEGMRGSHLRLYEILEVKPDEGFEVLDMWEDQRFFVRERAATRQIVAWDLVIARVGPGGEGETVFETLPYLFRAADKDDLLKGLRKAYRVFAQEFPESGLSDFFRKIAPVFHKLWLERVALPPRPKFITGDGEPFIFAKVFFDLVDREGAIRSLVNRDDVADQGDGSYVWLEPAGDVQRSIGRMTFEERRIVIETTSKKRAEKARDELPVVFGGAASFRAISYEDVEQAIKHAPPTSKKSEMDIPVEDQRKILGEFYEQHYRKRLDQPLPMLGNRTPRHAAGLKTVRPKLIALLKDWRAAPNGNGDPARSPTISAGLGGAGPEAGVSTLPGRLLKDGPQESVCSFDSRLTLND